MFGRDLDSITDLEEDTVELGAFSVSLAVKDLAASEAFYEKLGFAAMGGDASQGWLILKSGSTVIGLFQGMFEGNILTFNPGWAQDASPLESLTDVRELQKRLEARVSWLTVQVESRRLRM
jgi:catechol 2,3-dioxygenase-like lactoylglutathione lyase family enzyme